MLRMLKAFSVAAGLFLLLPVEGVADVPHANNLPLGYAVEFNVYDAITTKIGENTPNYDGFVAAAYKWADRYGLSHPPVHPPLGVCAQYEVVAGSNGGGGGMGVQNKFTVVGLAVADRSLAKELGAELSLLPGVTKPEIFKRVENISISGLDEATDGMTVLINGASYVYPRDFTPHEAQQLRWMIGALDNKIYYDVNTRLFADFPPGSSEKPRFDLGAVVRIAKNKMGELTIDTVRREWQIPASSIYQSWRMTLPEGFDESSIDPLKELSRKFDPLPGDSDPMHYGIGLDYWLLPKERILSQGYGMVSETEQQRIHATIEQMDKAVADWVEQHPSAQRSLVWRNRVWGAYQGMENSPTGYHVQIGTDSFAEAVDVRNYIAAQVPDAGKPEVYAYDHEQGRQLDPLTTPLGNQTKLPNSP